MIAPIPNNLVMIAPIPNNLSSYWWNHSITPIRVTTDPIAPVRGHGLLFTIQGDSGGICTNLGNDSMSDSKQKSSYKHGSDFERLWSYGHFLIPVHALM
jgi:hypothetical protein